MRPSYYRVARAYMQLVEEGKPPTYTALAKVVGVSRQAMWEMCQRHPDMLEWIDRRVQAVAATMTGAIVRRTGILAIQGSPQHAELFLKYMAGAFSRPEPGDPSGLGVGVGGCTINILVPRPPAAAGAPVVDAAPLRLPPPDLPVHR